MTFTGSELSDLGSHGWLQQQQQQPIQSCPEFIIRITENTSLPPFF